ncbi:MAG: ATP-binding protein [Acinetobacter sp.]|nr:MAG: ATP-binding protein [Acinetobacter sp.]
MRLHSLELRQIQLFKTIKIDFASAQATQPITVFLGEQQSGKTALLKHLFHGLSWFTARLKDIRSAGIVISDADMRINAGQATMSITISHPAELGTVSNDQHAAADAEQQCTWKIRKIKTTNSHIGVNRVETADLDLLVPRYQKQLEQDPQFALPCIAYYPTQRFVNEANLQAKNTSALSPVHQAYDLSPVHFTTFTKFFDWLREIYDLENAQSAQLLREYFNPQTRFHTQEQLDDVFSQLEQAHRLSAQRCMNSLRTAIQHVLPDIQDIWIEFQPQLQLMVNYQGQAMPFMQLSLSYRTWLALVGDVVRRVCLLNPQSLYPCLETDGIVLIDDIDTQLDSKHRPYILPHLHKAFPLLQFIVSSSQHDILDELDDVECYQLSEQHLIKPQLTAHQQQLDILYQQLFSTHSPETSPHESTSVASISTSPLDDILTLTEQLNEQERQLLLTHIQKQANHDL